MHGIASSGSRVQTLASRPRGLLPHDYEPVVLVLEDFDPLWAGRAEYAAPHVVGGEVAGFAAHGEVFGMIAPEDVLVVRAHIVLLFP